MNGRVITPPGTDWMIEDFSMAPARVIGDQLIASGIVASSADPHDLGDLAIQIHASFDHLDAILAATGATWSDVIELRSFHIDIATNKDLYLDIKNQRIGSAMPPAWTAIGVEQLWTPQARIETALTAILPARDSI